MEILKDEYKTPLAVVRGFFLCDNIATIQSPVRSVTLEGWNEVPAEDVPAYEVSLPLW
jgi:hypothetical protein